MTDARDAIAATVLAEGQAADSPAVDVAVQPVIAGRYEVQGFIGGGAMGTVYRARDRELDEIIALKVLKKELAGAHGMLERFRREVKLARRVTHRNVARMFDIGEDKGDRFLTMELIDGESLSRRLARHGRLPFREVAAITRDICAGLAVAHEAGVLHRDLKPDNVIVAKDGRAVITDFGIARAVAEGEAKTAVGSFVGTPLYMAPEQVEGMAELDARADLYALGAMMYELLTGEAAWQRPTIVAVAAARLLSPPPDPRAKLPDLPDDLGALVVQLMARQRDDRPKSAGDVVQALSAYESAHVPIPTEAPRADGDRRKRLAVMPLDVSEEDLWVAYALIDELKGVLQRADGMALRDIPPSAPTVRSVADARELGRTIDADGVVTGTARRKDDTLRVTLRLVTVEDGFQLWAQSFAFTATDVGRVADQAATGIAAAFTSHAVVARRATVNPAVEERYLKGRYLLHHGVGAFRDRSVEILREAYELAPDDARVAGGYAMALARAYRAESKESTVGDEAKRIALRALELDATRPEGRVALGTMYLADGEGEKAAVEIASALRVAPSSVYAIETMGRLLAEAGAAKEGLRLIDIALSKEDISIARHMRIRTTVLLGDWDDLVERMSELAWGAGGALASALLFIRFFLWTEDPAIAKSIAQSVTHLTLGPEVMKTLRMIAESAGSEESRAAVRVALGAAISGMPRRAARGRALIAQLQAESAFYSKDEAAGLAALREADEEKLFDLIWLDRCHLFDGVREHPDFKAVRASVADRAQAIVAAYERARVSSRVRG
jgi:eukaryotic-like serine/threonine-protein kinase